MWRNAEKTKREIMPLLYANKSIIIFDTETTGLGKTSKIIQFSGIRYLIDEELNLIETDILDIYLNPQEPLAPKIIDITGITDEVLKHAKTEDEQFHTIKYFLESADLWAAYNCSFDSRMLKQMCERTERRISERPCIDVLKLARDLIPREELENFKLETVSGYLFPSMHVSFHSAIEDVRATKQCMQKLILDLKEFHEDTDSKIQAYLEWASFTVNPKAKSQKRIKLKLNLGEYGDVFWDIPKKSWNCKCNSKAKKLFASLDMQNIERQVFNKYAWRYRLPYDDMELLASAMEKAKKEKKAS